MRHPMYSSLFGKSSFEAMPDAVLGLRFSAKHAYCGYQLRFGMQEPELLVRATGNGETLDLLPQSLFHGKFPIAFVEDFIHWYDHTDNRVEFRPRNDPWSTGTDHWRLKENGHSWRLTKPGVALLNISGNTSSALSKVLSPLESQPHIHALFDESSSSLDIEVPRLQLGFHLEYRGSQILSRQYRGMSVDPHQEIGTLAGLCSKLVLKRVDGDRLVLIPEGSVTYSKTADHVAVCIDKSTMAKIHAYQLDTTLGRLIDNGNLQSKLFLCHLHALTSYCLPDPLTGLTGTEAAISILRSGAVRSFDFLTKQNLSTLEQIARLAPERSYYPQNERVMQSVVWDPRLPFLSQEPIIYALVDEIFDQAREVKFLYPPELYNEPPILKRSDLHLLQRDLIRTSTFHVSGFGAENYDLQWDVVYKARDRDQASARGQKSFVAATLILRGQAALHSPPPSELFDTFRQKYFSEGTIHGPGDALPRLGFDTEWLSNPSPRIPAMWCSLHSSFGGPTNSYTKFDIMMWLSTVAFSKQADMWIIEALAALYRLPELNSVGIPQLAKFKLSNGDVLVSSQIQHLVQGAGRPFCECPEATLPKRSWESENSCRRRRASQFEDEQAKAVKSFTKALESQWPCKHPITPTTRSATTYLNVSTAMAKVSGRFETWHDNRSFYTYLRSIFTVLMRQVVVRVSIPQFNIILSARPGQAIGSLRYFSARDIFSSAPPRLTSAPSENLNLLLQEVAKTSRDTETRTRLTNLCRELRTQAKSNCETEYVLQLERSFSALQGALRHLWTINVNSGVVALLRIYLDDCKDHFQHLGLMLENTVKGGMRQSHRHIAVHIQHSPRISQKFWLLQLNRECWVELSEEWKTVIVGYGRAITELQRAHRLLSLSENPLELAAEVRNSGHRNWDPLMFPETLLLEAESGIMIREVQEEIARQMRSPPNNRNHVMQLNMGEGKSTVIVPIVAADAADGFRYVITFI